MRKMSLKVLMVVLAIALVSALVLTSVYATKAQSIKPGEMYDAAEDTTGTSGTVNKIIGTIITVVQIIGVGVAIIMLIVLAIKYISAAPGDKAEIKKHAVVYVVGAVVLFAASGILGIIQNISDAFTESAQ